MGRDGRSGTRYSLINLSRTSQLFSLSALSGGTETMLVIRSGRQPHEVMFLVFVAIVGVGGLLAPGKTANVVLKSLPPVFLILFYGVFAVGSTLALCGAYSKGMKGPVIEAFGLGIMTAELLGYGIAVLVFAGITAIIGSLFPLCMGIANVWRMLQVRGEYKAAAALAALKRSTEGA